MGNKKDLIIGILLGIIGAVVGCFIFLQFFTDYGFIDGVTLMKKRGILNKVITLGAILNLIIFFILLQKNKDIIAKGVVLAMFLITILTLVM
ncbi:hypothetical protein [Flavobacterium sp.]|jgi:hypothetical protein|uniref:hypothetical protein n=1 Tax=Flavobacterium sp. TaxID=239 RepID=UPI002A83766C|nr:hypothetical protein [Flavobacterium sp.]